MNRGQLIKAVAAHTRQDPKDVESLLTGMTDVITAVVSKGEPVTIQGFAKFAKVERAARMGRNPRTGEQIRIKASKRVRVSAMKAFKDTVMAPASAPRLGRGVWPTSRELLTSQAAERREESRAASGRGTATAARKAAGKKATGRKAAAKKTAARKTSAARRPAAKKTTAKRTPARKATARTTAARKTTARRAAPRKTAARKTATARRPAAKKTAARRVVKRSGR